jgi:sialic acid synthase SpsE
VLEPSEKEKEMRILAHRSITAKKDIVIDEVFTEDNICMKRPGDGLLGYEWDNVIGKKSTRNILCGEQIKREDVCG